MPCPRQDLHMPMLTGSPCQEEAQGDQPREAPGCRGGLLLASCVFDGVDNQNLARVRACGSVVAMGRCFWFAEGPALTQSGASCITRKQL